MNETYNLSQKLRQLRVVLVPVIITQLTMFGMNFFDTLMSGQASSYDLAGVAIGSSIWLPVSTGLAGIFMAVTPIVSQLMGANLKQEITYKVVQGIYLSLIISGLVICFGAVLLAPILSLMSLEDTVRSISYGYLKYLALGIPPTFFYYVLRSFMDGLGKTKVTMLIALLSLPINIILNYTLIFGKFGFPALGGVGAGLATAITYWFLAFISAGIIIWHDTFAAYRVFDSFFGISGAAWQEQLKIGLPIGFAIFFETGIFAVITLLMSNFNTYIIAAHQAAFNFAGLLYMIPLSISIAMTILVGFEVGGRRLDDARQYCYLGIGTSLSAAILCAIILFLFKEQIASLYSHELPVIQLTQQFLIYALFFQLSDAIAAPIQGALRGYKDVNFTLIMALFSYWALGLPVGYYLANFSDLGAFGYWIGLILGLGVNALGLFGRLFLIQRRFATRRTS